MGYVPPEPLSDQELEKIKYEFTYGETPHVSPPPCDHPASVKIDDARWVYGSPGIIYARYKCPECGMEWDDPTEPPPSSAVYKKG